MHISPSLPPSTPTLQAAFVVVPTWVDLSDGRRQTLLSHARSFASMAGLPPGSLLLTPQALRERGLDRSAMELGISKGTKANVLSSMRYILRRLDIIDPADTPFSTAWKTQLAMMPAKKQPGLVSFARFCSASGVSPQEVSLATIDALEAYLTERTLTSNPHKAAGAACSAWNRACKVSGWVGEHLGKRGRPDQFVLPLEAFTKSFQASLLAFQQDLLGVGLEKGGRFSLDDENVPLRKAVRPSTAALRVDHARWAASAVAAAGVPAGDIQILADLVVPLSRARNAIVFLFERRGRQRSAAATHVAEVLLIIARRLGLPDTDLNRLRTWHKEVRLRYDGITERNERAVDAAIQPDRFEALLQLPDALMAAARALRADDRNGARSLALRAVLIGILTRLPLRLANLAGLRLDQHLHRPDPRRGSYTQVMVSGEETKNGRSITLPMPPRTAALIDEWVRDYRPETGAGPSFLFPNARTAGKTMTHQALRDAIEDATRKHAGARLQPHQFRHLAAEVFLEAHPGHHEEVRQLLGHKSIATVLRSYAKLKSKKTSGRFQDILDRRLTCAKVPGRPLLPAPLGRRKGGH